MAELAKDATLDDIVFANRHKAYGAYDLRTSYPKFATRALLIGSAVAVLGIFAPRIIDAIRPQETQELSMQEVDLMKLPPPPLDPNEPPPPPPPPVEVPKVNTVMFLPPEVKPDEQVPEETPPPAVEELKEAVAAEKTQEGDPNAEEVIAAPEESSGPSKAEVVVEAPAPKEEEIFTVVEQNPEFVGGASAMYGWLGKNIKYPAAAQRANISGKVFVSFTVNTDGSITDAQVLKGLGFGTDEEALRVVKSMPKWKPGKQSGRAVRVKYNLPISFQLE